MYLKSRFPLKHNNEIKNMLEQKISGFIQEEECSDIISYMYNQDDADMLLDKIKKFYTTLTKSSNEM